MHFRLLLIIDANTMNPDPTSPIRVHFVCNFGSKSIQADKRADIKLEPNSITYIVHKFDDTICLL